ncbi:LEAF RUST 10 DISEASE-RESISTANCEUS RECEPTOR-LIKE PROTEIN KINASE-like 2.4 [Aristolochia californica]|uniref:LEAF RUST 10 DISEASE-RESISTANCEUS RECEPTOR-LIKE PROTEIN KINASE-like 2.4 n=1 Tax=Aristolochia californica TaxID=171875 RepID=UPI0035DFD16E
METPFLFLFTSFFVTLSFSLSQSQVVPTSTDPAYYYNLCGSSSCGNVSLRYPFSLSSFCAHPDLQITCVNNDYVVLYSKIVPLAEPCRFLGNLSVDAVGITIPVAFESLFRCGHVTRKNFVTDPTLFTLAKEYKIGLHLNCTQRPSSAPAGSLQPSSCLDCKGSSTGNNNICFYSSEFNNYAECENFLVDTREKVNVSTIRDLRSFLTTEGFKIRYTRSTSCRNCETSGGWCGTSPGREFVCFCASSAHRLNCSDGLIEDLRTWVPRERKHKISTRITAAIIASASVVVLVAAATIVILCVIRRKGESKNDDEKLIDGISPTRYSYSQIKKFTSNFSTKLGEGGFGSVYKGFIEGTGAVAVKLLKRSEQTEKQFMNEVATVGTVHHQHLVALLGYCAQDNNRALVYEFIEKGSLDKYIFDKKGSEDQEEGKDDVLSFTSRQMYNIAVETARGILYLHEGCRNKILHLDIKPHNVLIDSNLTAKVADFGLARLIDKDHSHLSLSHAQGTPGYAAPEIWTQAYGQITDKSDVYSYGMLLLEMARRRKNSDLTEEDTSRANFPDWVFKKAGIHDPKAKTMIQEVREGEGEEGEEEILKKMCMVGLWCIQHIATNRPPMRKVIQMLEGNSEIQIPPDPFPDEFNGEGFPTYYSTARASSFQVSAEDERL